MKFPSILATVLIVLSSLTSCQALGTRGDSKTVTGPRLFACAPKSVETGIASYYGGRWIGRKTANGERYRAGDITAAHKTLPFNTIVRVTSLSNNKTVLVRINNRGPFIRGRIIDLSMEAARELDMVSAGIRRVKVEVLEPVVPKEHALEYIANQRRASSSG